MAKPLNQLTQVTLQHVVGDFKEDIIGNVKILQGLVRTDAFVGLDIPNKANAREYVQTSNNVPAMITTLRTNPSNFVLNNNGIRIIASEVARVENGVYRIYIDDEEGVVNGNHTATVLRRHGVDRAYVPVFIQIGEFTKEQLATFSTSLNSHRVLDERSRQDKLDKFEWIKKLLDEDFSVQYHDGGAGDINIEILLRRAFIFNVNSKGRFNERAGEIRVGKPQLFAANRSGALESTSFVLSDIMTLAETIRNDEILLTRLRKHDLDGFISTKDGKVKEALVLQLLSLTKAYMHIPSGYSTWKAGADATVAFAQVRRAYTAVLKLLKANKYKALTSYDILRSNDFTMEMEGLRKTLEIDYLETLQAKAEKAKQGK